MERNQAEEIARSADRITEAVRELSRSLDRLAGYQEERRPGGLVLGLLGAGGMDDERATVLALGLKRHGEGPPRVLTEDRDPSPEEVRERREARRTMES